MSNIIVYTNDRSTQEDCRLATISTLNQITGRVVIEIEHPGDFVNHRSLSKGNILVVPGGSLVAQGIQLCDGVEKIRQFIDSNTGSYFGICAGAMLGKSNILNHSLRLWWTSTIQSSNETTPKIIDITNQQGKIIKTTWWCGGAFEATGNPAIDIAYYHPRGNGTVAVQKPRDNVLLSMIHPEFQMARYYPDCEGLKGALNPFKNDIKEMFYPLLASIGIKPPEEEKS